MPKVLPKQRTDKEWAAYFSEVLRRLDNLAARTAKNSKLGKLVDGTREGVASLIGYFMG
jgi:hypothetical protein